MTDQELVRKLLSHYQSVSKMLSLGNLELLKSDELYKTKYNIEDTLKNYQTFFNGTEAEKIEEIITKQRITPELGIFLESNKVNSELTDLYVLLKELITTKDYAREIDLDATTRASGF